MNRKAIILIVSTLIICIYIVQSGASRRVASAPDEEAYKADREFVIERSGRVESLSSSLGIRVVPEVAGTIQTLSIREGDLVQEGDVIGRINRDKELVAVKLAEARLELETAKLEKVLAGHSSQKKEQAKAKRYEAVAEWSEKHASLNRSKHLFEEGVLSKEELDRIEARSSIARARLEFAEHFIDEMERGPRDVDVQIAKANVNLAGRLLDQARQELSETVIYSPISGVIVGSTSSQR